METIRNIAYNRALGFWGEGDLYLSENPENAPATLVIHSGGRNSMDRSDLAGIAAFLAETELGAFNVNYRLLKNAP